MKQHSYSPQVNNTVLSASTKCIPQEPIPLLLGQLPSNYTVKGEPVNYLTFMEEASGFSGYPSSSPTVSGTNTASSIQTPSFTSWQNSTGYCAMLSTSPERRAPVSFNVKTYCTPGTGTLTIYGVSQTQSRNFSRQYRVAASVYSTEEASFLVLVVVMHPTGTSAALPPSVASS